MFRGVTALTRVGGKDLVVRFGGGYSSADFDLDTGVGGGSIETDGPILIPAIYYAMELNEDWALGVSVNATGGFATDLRRLSSRVDSDYI